MAENSPSFWVRWVAGIAATIVSTYLIVNFVQQRDTSENVALERYDADGKAFSFAYPAFLGHVKSIRTDTGLTVVAGRTDYDFFDSLLMRPYGAIVVNLWPSEEFTQPRTDASAHPRETGDSDIDPTAADEFVMISRQLGNADQRPTHFYEDSQDPDTGVVRAQYLYVGKSVVLLATGAFVKSLWDKHVKSIRQSLQTIKVFEANARQLFMERGWLTIAIKKTSEGTENAVCSPSVWTRNLLEDAGYTNVREYTNLKIMEFRSADGKEPVLRLVRKQEDCNRVQTMLDKRAAAGR